VSGKTDDIEFALTDILDRHSPLTLEALEERLYGIHPQLRAEQRTWIGIAVHNLLRNGTISAVGCDSGHSHEGYCVVGVAR
jgi:hypothetical protein